MSTISRMEKLSMANVDDRIILGNKKRTTITWMNLRDTVIIKRNQTQKEYTLYDFIYMKYKSRQKLPILKI